MRSVARRIAVAAARLLDRSHDRDRREHIASCASCERAELERAREEARVLSRLAAGVPSEWLPTFEQIDGLRFFDEAVWR